METLTVPVRVAGELVIKVDDLPMMALEQIKAALTIVNEEREKAASIKQFGWWDMPETVPLYRFETRRGGDNVICLPRGFSRGLVAGLASMGIQIQLDDQRTKSPASPGYFRIFQVRDYQLEAVLAILKAEQGIYKAPAGSGKTVTSLATMAYADQRTLVIVDKTQLANQWRVRAHQFFGMPLEEVEREDGTTELVASLTKNGSTDLREVGLIGNDVWEERDLTICLRQTLHSRDWTMDATGWWGRFGMVFYDECHHLAAETLADISRKITAFYIPGVSATPAKSEAKGQIVSALIGPIIHETPRQILYDRGVLMKPRIEVLKGDFYAAFHPDHDSDPNGSCQVEGCPKARQRKKHSHRNNYSSILKRLVEDKDRNKRIADRVALERGHTHLVASGQLKHLDLLRKEIIAAGWPEEKIWKLTGKENAEGLDQKIIQDVMDADEAVILATIQVAGEALDVPPIDRVHIVFPMRDQGATIQLVGRGERVFPSKKTDALVIDYREYLVDVLEGQFGERDRTYRMQGYDITESAHGVEGMKPENRDAVARGEVT